MSAAGQKRRIGIVGYGSLGQRLVEGVLEDDTKELAFVWNRSVEKMQGKVPPHLILKDLRDFASMSPDLVVEVAHPDISHEFGASFLAVCDYLMGSPTALARAETEQQLRGAAQHHGLYVPAGALWGGEDIRRMADRGTLQELRVTMRKHPDSFKLGSPLREKNSAVTGEPVILYEGPVRGLCPLAPNNVNTMAVASVAAHSLGFDRVTGRLIADPSLREWHIVEVDAYGPGDIAAGTAFHVHTARRNPARPGAVTGAATYTSFAASLNDAHGRGPGVHLC